MRLLLRAVRRAGVRLVYSRGFNPKPKVGFSPALPMGLTSEAEYFDFESYDRIEAQQIVERVNAVLPGGIHFDAVREIPRNLPALSEAIQAARYRVLATNGLDVARAIRRFRERETVTVTREGKNGKRQSFDLGTEILDLEPTSEKIARMTLAMRGDRVSLRPQEALREIFGEDAVLSVTREELLVDWQSRMVNPLLAAAASDAG
jgi:radical SAM-linked protein